VSEDRVYLAGGEDELGDHHLLATDNLERAIAAYRDFEARFGKARANEGLADAMGLASERR
jgi:hypothetical protein